MQIDSTLLLHMSQKPLYYLWVSGKYVRAFPNKANFAHCLPAKEYRYKFTDQTKFDEFCKQLDSIKVYDKTFLAIKETTRTRNTKIKASMVRQYEAFIADVKRQQALVTSLMNTLTAAGVTIDQFHYNKNYPKMDVPDIFYEDGFEGTVIVNCVADSYFDDTFGPSGERIL